MSNRTGLCWHCIKRDNCSMFKKYPDKITINCGRFKAKDYQIFFDEFINKMRGKK